MKALHTPGPWKLEISAGPWVSDAYVRADKWGVVARLGLSYSLPHWDGPQRANARLIAAAPDLLDELKKLRKAYVSLLESGRDRIIDLGGTCDAVAVMEANDPNLRSASDVIAKAGGAA